MLNVPWEFQQGTRAHRESRCDKWTNTYVLPHSDPWVLNRILAQTPGNKQRGYKQKMTVAFHLMRIFPLGPSFSLHYNCKVDTQHPQPALRWDIAAVEASASPCCVNLGVQAAIGNHRTLGLHEEDAPNSSPCALCWLRNCSGSKF